MSSCRTFAQFATLIISSAVFLFSCPHANAQSKKAVAELLFKEAMTLTDEGKYGEACPKLGKSDELDPLPVTKYWLADCYEHLGRVASAWTIFIELASATKSNPQQAQQAQQRAKAIEKRLPKLQINVPAGAIVEGLHIHRNGESVEKDFWGQPVPVDPGDYSVTATAPGKKLWEGTRTLAEGDTAAIDIPILEDPPKNADKKERPPEPNPGLRYAAIGTGALGVVGLAVGTAFGISAMSKRDSALPHCDNNSPKGPCGKDAVATLGEAKTSATLSTAGFVIGGISVATAIPLFVMSRARPTPATTGWLFVPVVDPQHLGGYAKVTF